MNLVFPSLTASGSLSQVAKDWDIELILEGFPQQVLASLKAGGFNTIGDICSVGPELVGKLVLLKHIKEKTATTIAADVDHVKESARAYLFDSGIQQLNELVITFNSKVENYCTVYTKTCCGQPNRVARERIEKDTETKVTVNLVSQVPLEELLVVVEEECFVVFDTAQPQKHVQLNQCFMVVGDTKPVEHTEEYVPLDRRFTGNNAMSENTKSLFDKIQSGILTFFKKK